MSANTHRFYAPGTITPFQLQTVEDEGVRALYSWGSLSHEFHPRTMDELIEAIDDMDDE